MFLVSFVKTGVVENPKEEVGTLLLFKISPTRTFNCKLVIPVRLSKILKIGSLSSLACFNNIIEITNAVSFSKPLLSKKDWLALTSIAENSNAASP